MLSSSDLPDHIRQTVARRRDEVIVEMTRGIVVSASRYKALKAISTDEHPHNIPWDQIRAVQYEIN